MEQISILAVDDEPFNLDLIEVAFDEYENVQITNAINGTEALSFMKKGLFDVVLLDICMPEMDGLEVLKKIRTMKEYEQLPVLMVTANPEKEHEALSLGASDFIAKPYDVAILCARTLSYAKLNLYHKEIRNQKEILELEVQKRTIELQEALITAKKTEYEISVRLGLACEFRDLETGGHIRRMSHYSKLLARLYGLDEEECELILYAAPLHDIGKVGIPDKILLKSGPLERHEFEIMKQHTSLGAKMLEGSDVYPVLKAGRIIALEHHEKWNGTGYPNAKKEGEIHLYARIVSIADVFDALSSRRRYKEPMSLDRVQHIIRENSGRHFDPRLVQLFLDHMDQFLEIKEQYSDNESTHDIVETIDRVRPQKCFV